MDALVSNPDHGEPLIEEFNDQLVASRRLQLFFDDLTGKINELGTPDGGTIEPSLFLQSSIIYKPSVGIEVVPAVINENEFIGRPLGQEIQGLSFDESWAILGNGSGNITINIPGASRNFTVESNISPTMFQVLGSTNRIGISPSGIPASKGTVHIVNSVAGGGVQGTITVNPDGDDLILEHDFFGGMSIHNGNNGVGSIYWGSPNWGGTAGQLWFLHDIDLGAIGAPSMGFDILADTFISMFNDQFDGASTGVFINPNQNSLIDFQINTVGASPFLRVDSANDRMGVSDSSDPPTKGLIHIIQNAPAGSATPASFGSAIVIESDQSNGITFITIDSLVSSINFGNHVNPIFARFLYDHNFTNTNQGFKFFFSVTEALQLLPSFGFDWNPNQTDLMDFRIRGFGATASHIMFVDGNAKRTGFSNTNAPPTDGVVHIHNTATAGAVDANPAGATLVLESNGNTGMSLLSPAANFTSIYFGSPVSNFSGIFRFNHITTRFESFVQGTAILSLALLEAVVNETALDVDFRVEGVTSTHLFITDASADRVGISDISIAPTDGLLHLHQAGSAGVIAASALANGIVLESNADTGLSILVPNDGTACNIFMGAPTSGNAGGKIIYVPSTGLMTLETSTLPAIRIDTNQNILLGTLAAAATTAAGALHIPNDTSPTAVLANAIVIGSKDSGAGGTLAVPELWIEEPPEVVGTFTPTMKFKVWINGVEYFIQLDPV